MFSSGNQKNNVIGFSLTPGIGLEAVILDKNKTCALNYGRKKVDYNFSTREIQNYTQFKTALVQLMDELKIQPKSFAYLVLPNVFFDFIELPPDLPIEGIETSIISKAEEFYLFKKDAPVSGWCEVANQQSGTQKKIAYSSFQSSAIDNIKEIFADVGLNLAGIETAYSATLRGLNLTGMINDVVMMDTSWTTMVINTNSFTLFQLDGKNLLDCSEVPLAIKSFSPEEAYQAIVSSCSQMLNSQTTSQLYIISQTDDISAEALKRIMQFDREITAIDLNKFAKKSLIDVIQTNDFNEANSMTLSVIGAADFKSNFGLTLNIFSNDPNATMGVYFTTAGGMEVNADVVQKTSIIATISLFLILGLITFGGITLKNNTQSQIDDLTTQINNKNSEFKRLSAKDEKPQEEEEVIDMTTIIDEVAAGNVSAIKFYDSISSDIPKNVWLTKYYNQAGDKIVIRGIAESIIDIYEYYKNLRVVSPQSNIKLNELRVVTQDDGSSEEAQFLSSLVIDKDIDRLYSFEISNTQLMSESEEPKVKKDEASIIAPKQILEKTSSQMRPAR